MTPVKPTPVGTEEAFVSGCAIFAPEIRELEVKFSRQALNALEAIGQQMESEIFKPILHTVDNGRLQETFRSALKRYTGLYLSQASLIWSQIRDISEVPRVCAPLLVKLKTDIEEHGKETIGEEATNDMLVGLATVALVNRKLMKVAQTTREMGDLNELLGWSISYWLASSCVYSYHFDRQGNQQNVRVLASWSRYYATGMYQCAKTLRVIEVPVGTGEIPEASDDDRFLAEAGLEDLLSDLLEDKG